MPRRWGVNKQHSIGTVPELVALITKIVRKFKARFSRQVKKMFQPARNTNVTSLNLTQFNERVARIMAFCL